MSVTAIESADRSIITRVVTAINELLGDFYVE